MYSHTLTRQALDRHSQIIVGRSREQLILRDHLASAVVGRGSLVLIAGESGIGKTTLAQSLAQEAEQRALVLTGCCYDLSANPPYGVWLDLFSSYPNSGDLPALPDSLSHPSAMDRVASQEAFFADVHGTIVEIASQTPLVLVLEDLHWSDPASLELLRYLARQLSGASVLVIVTYRPQELGRRHPLYQLLPALVREAPTERLNLRRLGDDELRMLLGPRYQLTQADEQRLASYLHDHAEGNPFFIGELLRVLEEENVLSRTGEGWSLGQFTRVPVPSLLRQVVDGRLERFGEETRELLEVAAVIGQEAPIELWRAVSGAEDEVLLRAIERATEAHLLEETAHGDGLRFTHALVREALYEGIVLPRRRVWHRRTGEALAASPMVDIEAVAYHFHESRHEQATDWLMRAGERAEQLYAWRTAAEHFEMVLRLLDDRFPQERGWLSYRIGVLLRYADPRRGIVYLEEADSTARELRDEHLAACAAADRGLLRCLTGDARRGLDEMQAAVSALTRLRSTDVSHCWRDESERRGPVPGPAIERIRRGALNAIGQTVDLNAHHGPLALWLAWVGRYAEALTIGERCVAELANRPDGPGPLLESYGDALAGLGHANAALGRPGDALGLFERARQAYGSLNHHFKVGNTAIYELFEAVLPYEADQVKKREWLAAQAEYG